LLAAIPAQAAVIEGGWKSCSSSAHVYTKARWYKDFYTWIDVTGDGVREVYVDDWNGGVWETDYANLYGWGTVKTWVNSGYYEIAGWELSTTQSWPGCEAD
jgi:hypothetical protein